MMSLQQAASWIPGSMALGDTSLPLNAGSSQRLQTTGFGSLHGDGANILFCDGTVRFVSTKISIETYRELSRIDDGSVICEF